jgi:hypothetical protein
LEFFAFCTELLAQYRDCEQVMHISGDGSLRYPMGLSRLSYAFSSELLIWGWATWRRAWKNYDASLTRWAAIRSDPVLVARLFGSPSATAFWSSTLNRLLDAGEPDTWDYQWSFSVFERSGLAIVPGKNLITNVGHRPDATHTFDPTSARAGVESEPIFPLTHPRRIAVRRWADRRFQRQMRDLGRYGRLRRLWVRGLSGAPCILFYSRKATRKHLRQTGLQS